MEKLDSIYEDYLQSDSGMGYCFPQHVVAPVTTISVIVDVYCHVLAIPNLGFRCMERIVESLSILLTIATTTDDTANWKPSVCLLVDTLFRIECGQLTCDQKEVLLTKILLLFSRLLAPPYLQYLEGDNAWSILFSFYYIYSDVSVDCFDYV